MNKLSSVTNKSKSLCLIAYFLILLLDPHLAFGEVYRLIDGQRRDIDSVTDVDQALFYASRELSYCCRIWSATDFEHNISFDAVLTGTGTIQVSNRGNSTPHTASRQIDTAFANRCFIMSGASFSEVVLRLEAGSSGTGTTNNVSMLCEETTLYGGFNTVATDYNFIEITNTLVSNLSDDGSVEFTVQANGVIANQEILNQSFTIAAGKRKDINIHANADNDFGSIKITHNGPKGALRAVLVQYKITNPATGEFEPVLSVPFHTRASE